MFFKCKECEKIITTENDEHKVIEEITTCNECLIKKKEVKVYMKKNIIFLDNPEGFTQTIDENDNEIKIYCWSNLDYNTGLTNYNEYKMMVGGKTWDGKDMKHFSEMPPKIIRAWIQAGKQTIQAFLNNENIN